MAPTLRSWPMTTSDVSDVERDMRNREYFDMMERELEHRHREALRDMQNHMDRRIERERMEYDFNRYRDMMEDRISNDIREQIDREIVDRVAELANHPIGAPWSTENSENDDRSDDDKYLERLGV